MITQWKGVAYSAICLMTLIQYGKTLPTASVSVVPVTKNVTTIETTKYYVTTLSRETSYVTTITYKTTSNSTISLSSSTPSSKASSSSSSGLSISSSSKSSSVFSNTLSSSRSVEVSSNSIPTITSAKAATSSSSTSPVPTTSSRASEKSSSDIDATKGSTMTSVVSSQIVRAAASAISAFATPYAQCGGQSWTGATSCIGGYYCRYQDQYYSQCVPNTSTSSAPSTTSSSVTSTNTYLPATGYAQCGGLGFIGPTTCIYGWVCTYQNAWYSQCVPSTSSTPSSSSSLTSTKATTTTTYPLGTPWAQCGGIGFLGAALCVNGWVCTSANPWFFQCAPSTSSSSSSSSVSASASSNFSVTTRITSASSTSKSSSTSISSNFVTSSSSTKVGPSSVSASSSKVATITSVSTTMSSTSASSSTNTFAPAVGYAQCGGSGFVGPSKCIYGWVCTYQNQYYSQCLPDPSSTSSKPTTTEVNTWPPGTPWAQCGGVGWGGAINCVAGWICTSGNPWFYQCSPATTGNIASPLSSGATITSSYPPSIPSTTAPVTKISTNTNSFVLTITSNVTSTASTTSVLPATTSAWGKKVYNATLLGYNYLGCFYEPPNFRALSFVYASDTMTVPSCIAACQGYRFIGLEYSRECWCANTTHPDTELTIEADCQGTCSGNSSQMCGGPRKLNLYGLPGAFTDENYVYNATTLGFTYYGCWAEPYDGSRALNKLYANNNMTVAYCATLCANYTWIGVEYGRECWCGNSLSADATTANPYDCSYPCAGDSNSFCGGSNRLNLYYQSSVANPLSKIGNMTTKVSVVNITTLNIDPYIYKAYNNCADGGLCMTCQAAYSKYTAATFAPQTIYSTLLGSMNSNCASSITQGVNIFKQAFGVLTSCFSLLTTSTVYSGPIASRANYDPSAFYTSQAKSPCCGQCTVFADQAEVMYFPPDQPDFTTLVTNDLTLTSPTLYLVFQTLSARNLCSQVGQIRVGSPVPIPQGVLSTLDFSAMVCDGVESISTLKYNVAQLDSVSSLCNSPWDYIPHNEYDYYESVLYATTARKRDLTCGVPNNFVDYVWQKCHPQIILPTEILGIDRAWSTCTFDRTLALDPHYRLTRRVGLKERQEAPISNGGADLAEGYRRFNMRRLRKPVEAPMLLTAASAVFTAEATAVPGSSPDAPAMATQAVA